MTITKFGFPTPIHFGPGARKLVGDHLREVGVKRPIIVTDKGLAALPVMAEFRNGLGAGLDVAVFSGVYGNPTRAQVMEGAAAARAHRADCVIGFGGGAGLDVAKVVALMTTHDGDVMEYVWDHPKVRPISGELPYFVALPTTSGTGSEVGRSSVVSEDDTHVKRIVFSPRLLAKVVFADPELTLALPAGVTAATGMDALTHNVESYLCPSYHPMCDGIALEGIRIAARALPIAVRDPGNLQARGDMMMSSMMGAVAFQKDLGAVHACAHALSTVADLHHGLANALMIEPVMLVQPRSHPREVHGDGSRGRRRQRRCLRALAEEVQGDHRHPRVAWRDEGHQRPDSRARGRGRERHLPPDQPAALHSRRLHPVLRAGALI